MLTVSKNANLHTWPLSTPQNSIKCIKNNTHTHKVQELKLISHIYIINMQSVETSWPVDMLVFFQINARLWLKHANMHFTPQRFTKRYSFRPAEFKNSSK